MIDRTKSSSLLYQNTGGGGVLDVIITVGQYRSPLSYIYLINLKRVHVAKDTKILGCGLRSPHTRPKLTLIIAEESKFGNLARCLLLLPKTCPAFSLLEVVPDVIVVFVVPHEESSRVVK